MKKPAKLGFNELETGPGTEKQQDYDYNASQVSSFLKHWKTKKALLLFQFVRLKRLLAIQRWKWNIRNNIDLCWAGWLGKGSILRGISGNAPYMWEQSVTEHC